MFKKLMAGVLAVMTAVSCAALPSAAFAAETEAKYEKADAVKYAAWKLKNPDVKEEEREVTAYIAWNDPDLNSKIPLKLGISQCNPAGVKKALEEKYQFYSSLEEDGNPSSRCLIAEPVEANDLYYIAVRQQAAVFYTSLEKITPPILNSLREYESLSAELTAEEKQADYLTRMGYYGRKLLGYYDMHVESDGTAALDNLSEVYADMYARAEKEKLQPKTASGLFTGRYQLEQLGAAEDFSGYDQDITGGFCFYPDYTRINNTNYQAANYEKVTLTCLDLGQSGSITCRPDQVISGSYVVECPNNTEAAEVYLPKHDRDNWNLYLDAYARANWRDKLAMYSTNDESMGYFYSSIVQVGEASENKPAKFALAYLPIRIPDKTASRYTLTFVDEDGNNICLSDLAAPDPVPYTMRKFATRSDSLVGSGQYQIERTQLTDGKQQYYYTEDPEEIYGMEHNEGDWTADYATLQELLTANRENPERPIYELTGTIRNYQQSTQIRDHKETCPERRGFSEYLTGLIQEEEADIRLAYEVVTKYGYTVYSYTPDGGMLKRENVRLTNAEAKADSKGIIPAKAEALGIEPEVYLNQKRMVFDHAELLPGRMINVIYRYENKNPDIKLDFAMAAGKFDDISYYGRVAKAGDQVRLKVSFADAEAAAAKGYTLENVTVKFNAKEAASASAENITHVKSAEDPYESGIANMITLGTGMNIVTATVFYNGTEIGTTEMFYAYVAE